MAPCWAMLLHVRTCTVAVLFHSLSFSLPLMVLSQMIYRYGVSWVVCYSGNICNVQSSFTWKQIIMLLNTTWLLCADVWSDFVEKWLSVRLWTKNPRFEYHLLLHRWSVFFTPPSPLEINYWCWKASFALEIVACCCLLSWATEHNTCAPHAQQFQFYFVSQY